jgi:hypothetical protein
MWKVISLKTARKWRDCNQSANHNESSRSARNARSGGQDAEIAHIIRMHLSTKDVCEVEPAVDGRRPAQLPLHDVDSMPPGTLDPGRILQERLSSPHAKGRSDANA